MPPSLFLVVKWTGRSLAVTSVAGSPHCCRLFYVHDSHSNTRFLVNTGAVVSVIPPTHAECSRPQGIFTLQAVDGTQISTYGVRSCTLNIGLRHTFRWVFIIANVNQAILCADFLHHFGLIVDIWHRTLSDSTTHLQVNGLSSITHPHQDSSNPFLILLSEFPGVTRACAPDHPVKHNASHYIKTTGPPVSSCTCRLAPEHLRIACQEFDHMLELSKIRPSSSSWSSPSHGSQANSWRLETMWGFPCSQEGNCS